MVDLNVNFIYGVNHGCQILVLLIDILVTGRENTETHNSRCLEPGRLLGYWGVNYHSVVDNETLEFLIILLMIICSWQHFLCIVMIIMFTLDVSIHAWLPINQVSLRKTSLRKWWLSIVKRISKWSYQLFLNVMFLLNIIF